MNPEKTMLFIFVVALSVTACSKNTREKTETLSETASCSSPQFSRSEKGTVVEITFVERLVGEREHMTQDCTTYLTNTQKMLAKSGGKIGRGKVVGTTVGTAIALPFTLLGDIFQLGSKKSRTTCKGWVLKETKTFEEDVVKSAKFKGDVTLVSIENPEDAETRTIEEATEKLSFSVDSATENFLLHISGKYSTAKTNCDVDQQILLQGKDDTKAEEAS